MRKKPEDMSYEELVGLVDWMLKRVKYLKFLMAEIKGS